MSDPQVLRTTIDELRDELEALPHIDSTAGDITGQHQRHRAAAEKLADHLRVTHGARIRNKAWTNTIRMHGISSSGTSGLVQAFRNWIAAAERRIASINA